MNTTEIGKKAERAASVYLELRGFKIIERNWRRPRCEIDVIASKEGVVHFIEVKYRFSDDQGGGLDAITVTKLKQMQRAAWTWVNESSWHGEYMLSAVEISGPAFTIMGFMENVY